jgi:hemolysin activation/secretion protein
MHQPSRVTQVLGLLIGLTVSMSGIAASHHKKAHKGVKRRHEVAKKHHDMPKPVANAQRTGIQDVIAEKTLNKMLTVPRDERIKYLKLAQDLPGVTIRTSLIKDQKGTRRLDFSSHVKRYDARWFVQNGGNDPKVGRFPISLGVSANSLFGGDRLSLSGDTTEQFGPTWSIRANYQKVLNTEGLRLRVGYLHSEYTQPWEQGQFFLYKTRGNAYSLSLQQPLLVGRMRRLDVYAGMNYAEGNPESTTQDAIIFPASIKVDVHEPTVLAGVVYSQNTRIGKFLGNLKLTKGMDLPGLKTRYTATGRPTPVAIQPDPETHFLKMNLDLSQQVRLNAQWQLGLSYRFQLSNRTLPLPTSQKINFNDGAYMGQGYAGDVGQGGRIGLSFQPLKLSRALTPIRFELYYAAGSIKNYAEDLPYQTATPQTIGLRASFSVPKAHVNGFVDVAEPFVEPLSVSGSDQTVVLFGIGQSF